MSGICGIFNLDGAPVAESELRAMMAMLERRGPEDSHLWQQASAGFGHTLLATTPELQFERQPFVHQETGCVITADVRLDNRDELLDTFDLAGRHKSVGDAELILLAWLQWGAQCPARLLGDFAFAIWDPRHQKLFCARDHFGVRPLYYHHNPGKHFLFASDPRAILVLPRVPYRINEGRVADFLVPELEWIDYTSTFFEGVYRLPPGHAATVTSAGTDVSEYWKPEPGPELGPMSDEDYAQGFVEVFSRAVDARLRAPEGTVGAMLSGGMDSGTAVAIAKEILQARGGGSLATFSAVRPLDNGGTECAESQAIYASVSTPSVSATVIHPDVLNDVYRQLISAAAEPFDCEFMFLKAIYGAAHDQGIRVVLDGGAGDIILSEGSYVVRLIRLGHFRHALAEITAESKFWGGSLAANIFRYTRSAVAPEFVKNRLRGIRDRQYAISCIRSSLIGPDFAAKTDVRSRFERMRETFGTGWIPDYAVERCRAIRPNETAGLERYARIAAAAGAEGRDPYLDKRVVDFCTRLPGRLRLMDGLPKSVMREVMADRLPAKVLQSRRNPHIGWLFNAAVTSQALKCGELSLAGLGEALTDYVDSAALADAWRNFRAGGDAEQIHSAYVLSAWLQESVSRPVVPG